MTVARRDIPKVVGGHEAIATELAATLYEAIFARAVRVSSTRVAEMTKLLENIYRCVNIALVNELKLLSLRMGVDIWEVIDAAATKPFGFQPFYPGPGLGGHCIPIDPFYLSWKAREFDFNTRFIELAGEVNEAMPAHVAQSVAQALNRHGKAMKGARILMLGMAYKKDIDDLRESPSLTVIELLREQGAEVLYNDPYFPAVGRGRHYNLNMTSTPLTNLAQYDCVLIMTDHTDYDYRGDCGPVTAGGGHAQCHQGDRVRKDRSLLDHVQPGGVGWMRPLGRAAEAGGVCMQDVRTINDAFLKMSGRGDKVVWRWLDASAGVDGEWKPIASAEAYGRVRALAARLAQWGVVKGDRVALISENRWEWPVADFAVLALGAVDVPLYMTLTPEQVGYMLRDSGAKVAVVSSWEQMEKVRAAGELPSLERLVVMDEMESERNVRLPLIAIKPRWTGHPVCSRWRVSVESCDERCGGDAGARCGVRRARALGAAGRSGHHHLHLWHHRRAQGRDADPWKPGQQLHHVDAALRVYRAGQLHLVSAALPCDGAPPGLRA